MPRDLNNVTYETIGHIRLSVSDMLTLANSLHDAVAHNEAKGWPTLAQRVRELHNLIRPQIVDLIDEADRKLQLAKLEKEPATSRQEPPSSLPHPNDYRD